MKFERMIFWLTVFLVFIMAARISIDSDSWWHIRAGQWMVEHRQIITQDYFSFTRYGSEWKYPGWLVEIPLYLIYQYLGPGGLNLLTALLISSSFGLIFLACSGNVLLRAFVIIFSAVASGVYWSARPHLFTILLGSAFLYIMEEMNKEREKAYLRNLVLLQIFLMLVWVNSHGGFIFGFILWGGYLGGSIMETVIENVRLKQKLYNGLDSKKPLVVAGIGMFIAGLLNPMGYKIYAYPFKTIAIEALRAYIQEWQSPNFHSISVQPFIWLLIMIFFSLGYKKRRVVLSDLIIISSLLYLSLTAGRNIALFALMTPIMVTRYLQDYFPFVNLNQTNNESGLVWGKKREKLKNLLHLFIVGVAVFTSIIKIATVYPDRINQKYFGTVYPVKAVEYLKQHRSSGKLFNSYNWGGYLLWSLPEYPVFVDGRTDLYNDEIIGDWLAVAQYQHNWEDVLEKWGVKIILMEREWIPAKLLTYQGWCKVYEDELAIILSQCR